MCGFVYSTDKTLYHLNLDYIASRGPDAANTLINNLGYFYHARLATRPTEVHQPAKNKFGILLYNGTEYSLENNDVDYILGNLSDNVESNIEFLKTLNGDFSICWITEQHILLAKDCFGTKPLYFGIQGDNFIAASVESFVKSANFNPIKLEQNLIIVLDKKTLNLVYKTEIVNWDISQGKSDLDDVFIEFERSVLERHEDNCLLKMSSGYDSGVMAACLNKHKKNYSIASYLCTENKQIMKDRYALHDGKKTIYSYNKFLKSQELRKTLSWDLINRDTIVADVALLDCEFSNKNNIRVIITGVGADELYCDYGFNGLKTRHVSLFGGHFPKDLDLIWPWHDSRTYPLWLDVPIIDYVNGLYGIDSRHPFIDRRLFQTWLNTPIELKNNSYKHWMEEYLKQNNYPYVKNEKIGMGNLPLNF